jgi:hypothetical protein
MMRLACSYYFFKILRLLFTQTFIPEKGISEMKAKHSILRYVVAGTFSFLLLSLGLTIDDPKLVCSLSKKWRHLKQAVRQAACFSFYHKAEGSVKLKFLKKQRLIVNVN